MRQLVVWTSLVVLLAATAAWAQSSTQPGQQPTDPMSSLWNPQMMIERSVKQASARYHLTPEQEQVARKMTTDGVNAFLDKHEQELRSLMTQAVQARLSGQTPAPEQAKAWAEKAQPLFEEAKKAILDGNRQFRNSLTDEQKKTFDDDQKTMEQQFTVSADTLDRWKKGGFDPNSDWNMRQPGQDSRQSRPELDRFERYARRFIENYKLDSTQGSQVLAIASESRKRAEEYWLSHKTDIQATRNRVQDLSRDPKNRAQYLEATRQLTDLNKPVNDLFGEMRERLDRIPNDAQRKAYEAQAQARRDAWREQMRRNNPDNTVASSASQTASSQVAATQVSASQTAGTQTAEGKAPATGSAASRPSASRPASQPAKASGAQSSRPASQPIERVRSVR